ncbi:L-serine ammonia-lyase, iron-sulfur-dependent subunit beta [Paenibacillus dauci]|uniref:L-serine ammonia-lyase, iron-sulfur-dependent subunit beta n=1 Tax=Paenibacillus dauci TaxID=1567106 RepID=UPI0006199AE1|nr:L-serine ammonia-lyase, iron-sulfur-dependent subunit beta [Paenibacillus dauci]
MRFKNVFNIIGPSMVGPSSSHTAGAARLGRAARQLLGVCPEHADIILYGSFAETYWGHGTDLALVGGLLDYSPDDPRLPDAAEEADQLGMTIQFDKGSGNYPHPNFVRIRLKQGEHTAELAGASIGGGNIEIHEMNGFDLRGSGQYPTLAVEHQDSKGVLADITRTLSESELNIGFMDVDRKSRSGEAMTVIELDSAPVQAVLNRIEQLPYVTRAVVINLD